MPVRRYLVNPGHGHWEIATSSTLLAPQLCKLRCFTCLQCTGPMVTDPSSDPREYCIIDSMLLRFGVPGDVTQWHTRPFLSLVKLYTSVTTDSTWLSKKEIFTQALSLLLLAPSHAAIYTTLKRFSERKDHPHNLKSRIKFRSRWGQRSLESDIPPHNLGLPGLWAW